MNAQKKENARDVKNAKQTQDARDEMQHTEAVRQMSDAADGGATPKLFDSEYRFACIVWAHEPLTTRELVRLCQEQLEWKRTTTYTVLKRLCERGVFQMEQSVVSSKIPRAEIQRGESRQFVKRTFGGSLPGFIAAFLGGGDTLTEQEAEEIKAIIDQHRRGAEEERT